MIDQVKLGVDIGSIFGVWLLFYTVSFALRAFVWAGF